MGEVKILSCLKIQAEKVFNAKMGIYFGIIK